MAKWGWWSHLLSCPFYEVHTRPSGDTNRSLDVDCLLAGADGAEQAGGGGGNDGPSDATTIN